MKFGAVVLSAGSGTRMQSSIPKQYLEVLGKPVIYYSLKAFQESNVSEIVLVCSESYMDYCRTEIVEKYHLTKVTAIVPGGKERYDSVLEGLRAIRDVDYVMIHDGARPMLTREIILRAEEDVVREDACVVGMPVKDTVKIADDADYCLHTPDRKRVWQIQTPQTFAYPLIRQAYEMVHQDMVSGKEMPAITDDAMVVEYETEHKVKFTLGSYENIKITTPEDLLIAELYLGRR